MDSRDRRWQCRKKNERVIWSGPGFYALLGVAWAAGCSRSDFIFRHEPLGIVIGVTPATATARYGESVSFSAHVTAGSATEVIWSVQEGPAGGTIDTDGVYTAPRVAGTFHVVATSAVYAAASGVAAVSVMSLADFSSKQCLAGSFTHYGDLGDGSAAQPHVLCSAAQLLDLMGPASASGWSQHFVLGADIDLTGYDQSSIPAVAPVGNATIPFTGVFDGQGRAIRNLAYNNVTQDDVGLFGRVSGSSAVVRNVQVLDATIQAGSSAGAVAGSLAMGASILQCRSSGSIAGANNVGGVIGTAGGDVGELGAAIVSACSSTAVVQAGSGGAGGLVGSMGFGFIINSSASGSVSSAGSYVGGLLGAGIYGSMTSSFATGNVSGVGHSVGGLTGRFQGPILHCLSSGNVVGSDSATAGLLVGDSAYGFLADDASFGGATCNSAPAGVVCHGPATGETQVGQLSNLYDRANSPLSAWDFTHVWMASTSVPILSSAAFDRLGWGMCAEHSGDAPFAGGWGTPEAPYLICTGAQLGAISTNAGYLGNVLAYELRQDIDLAGSAPAGIPVGTSLNPFVGLFDGAGHTVANLRLSNVADDGLFGMAEGLIKRLGVTQVGLSGNQYQGALVARLDGGRILDCFATGSVAGTVSGTGGLVGAIVTQGALVANSYFSGSVSGTDDVGGLVGDETGSDCAMDSFTSADVISSHSSGGPIGGNTVPDTQNNWYDATAACNGCANAYGHVAGATSVFFSANNPPLSSWDFTSVWQEGGPGRLPILRPQ